MNKFSLNPLEQVDKTWQKINQAEAEAKAKEKGFSLASAFSLAFKREINFKISRQ